MIKGFKGRDTNFTEHFTTGTRLSSFREQPNGVEGGEISQDKEQDERRRKYQLGRGWIKV